MNRRAFPRCIYGIALQDKCNRCKFTRDLDEYYCTKHKEKKRQKAHKDRLIALETGKRKSDYRIRTNYQSKYWQRRKESCKTNGLCMRCGKKNPRHGQFFSCGMCERVRRHRKNA